ncbi:MAG: Transcription termination/antitermination protein NusA [Firmicutes bacterium]|nr:Transcription termination/antitermination protein NusA [candidate division NPL-UPA2 bacterium]MBT9155773.1 Transcription termination/antitermination protein NusA [candidate division NPL-UPA2 bacterium]
MNAEFIEAIAQLSRERQLDKSILFDALETALLSAYKKNFGGSGNVRVTIDRETGEVSVYSLRRIVSEVKDANSEMHIDDAKGINPSYLPGDICETKVTPRNFGRVAAQTAKQIVVQRIREAERGMIYQEFTNRECDIVTGVIQRADRNVIIDLGKVEALLPQSEQVPGENYRPGQRLKTYVLEVRKTTKGPQVTVSRSHPGLLKRLLELEVPEIHDGSVELRSIAREAGSRSKVAVFTRDENIDPVGACVGPRGMRIQAIVSELGNEKVDVVEFRTDPREYVAQALSPAKVSRVEIDEKTKIASVTVPDYQLSLAIGKEGQNARLAAKLTGWKIDIKSESQAANLRLGM